MKHFTDISVAFSNLAQDTVEDRAAATNLTTSNGTLTEQVVMYANCLSNKEAGKVASQTEVSNLNRDLKTLKAEIHKFKKLGHSVGAGAAYKNNGRTVPIWKK